MYKNSAKQRASLTVRSQADYRLGTARRAGERLVPLVSWWLGLTREEMSAAVKKQAPRMNAISTNYRRKTEDFTRVDSL